MKYFSSAILIFLSFCFLTACDVSSEKKEALTPESIKATAQENGDDEVKIHYICDPKELYTKENQERLLGDKEFFINYRKKIGRSDGYTFDETDWDGGDSFQGVMSSRSNCFFALPASIPNNNKRDHGFNCKREYHYKDKNHEYGGFSRQYTAEFNDLNLHLKLSYTIGTNPEVSFTFVCKIDVEKQNLSR